MTMNMILMMIWICRKMRQFSGFSNSVIHHGSRKDILMITLVS